MRHRVKQKQINKPLAERKSFVLNFSRGIIENYSVYTTLTRAKYMRPIVEKLVTRAKDDTLHSRRILLKDLRDNNVVDKLIKDVAPSFSERNGGYTRIVRTRKFRKGDNAEMCFIEFVDLEKPKVEITDESKDKPKKETKTTKETETVEAEVTEKANTKAKKDSDIVENK